MKLHEVDRDEGAREEILDPELPIIDAHHHLWPSGYWIPYDRTALQVDLDRGHRVTATVFVECMTSFADDADPALRPVGETRFVVADTSDSGAGTDDTRVAAGIVAWADLMQPTAAARTLDAHIEAGEGRLRGVRFNVVWHDVHSTAAHAGRVTTPHMLFDDRYRAGLREVARRNLTYDVWLFHPQLPELADTLDAVPELTFVLDHLGGPVPDEATPASRAAIFAAWRQGLAEVARRPNVVLKIGGVGMPIYGFGFQDAERPGSALLADAWRPYVEAAIETFGPDRCMFESNFPVDKQSFSYDSLWNAFKRLTAGYSADERTALFSGTASQVYGL
jgi:predicted TIM-barrel fold metal-dependent hydrolase